MYHYRHFTTYLNVKTSRKLIFLLVFLLVTSPNTYSYNNSGIPIFNILYYLDTTVMNFS